MAALADEHDHHHPYADRNTVFDYAEEHSDGEHEDATEEHELTDEHLEDHAHEAVWEQLSDITTASTGAAEAKGGEGAAAADVDAGRTVSDESPGPSGVRDEDGVVYHAQIVPKGYNNPRHVTETGALKPRRPMPHCFASEFFGALEQVGDKWIFPGPLNGWPGLVNLELRAITCRTKNGFMGTPKFKRMWDASKPTHQGVKPTYPVFKNRPRAVSVRVTLRAPGWTGHGWSESAPGFILWFCRSLRDDTPSALFHGEDMLQHFRAGDFGEIYGIGPTVPQAVRATMFAHRYASLHESLRDMVVYHCGVLVEWDHGLFSTVVELAWKNGLGGYGGKSNWCTDMHTKPTALYAAMPGCMKAPWNTRQAELRAIDVPARDLIEFQAYMAEHTGPTGRFMDVSFPYSGPVRLSHRSQPDLMRFLLNYIEREKKYSEEARNCQTFSADLMIFLTGNAKIEPYHSICRVMYKRRPHFFLYETDPEPEPEPETPGSSSSS